MGLAAGINFSLRSVALAGESYRRDQVEQPLKADEILQMFGRAGRRGLDETGYVLITANELRLLDARPCHLSRSGAVDWGALLGIMAGAARSGRDPFSAAVETQERLFTTRPIFLGIEESLKHPDVPCGLRTDSERARHVRKRVREILNSRGEWEPCPARSYATVRDVRVGQPVSAVSGVRPSPGAATFLTHDAAAKFNGSILMPPAAPEGGRIRLNNCKASNLSPTSANISETIWKPALHEPAALEKVGTGTLCVLSELSEGKLYGREMTVADLLGSDRVIIAKWVRRLTNWNGRQAPLSVWKAKIAPLVERKLAQQKTPVVSFVTEGQRIVAQVNIAELTMRVPVDSHGVAIWKPSEREVLPADCARCALIEVCRGLEVKTGVALLWRRLGLVDISGVPTLCGEVVSFFSQGDGLAIAAALEDTKYPLDELIYDLANLDAGFRFCGEENRWAGRLGLECHERYGLQTIPGYLENGVPPKYGAGAEQIVASVHKNPLNKHGWITDLVGPGDIDRVIIEWRSLLRQIAHAPDLDWPRWRALQAMAKGILNETSPPTMTDLPPLEYNQTRRVDHRLGLRRQ